MPNTGRRPTCETVSNICRGVSPGSPRITWTITEICRLAKSIAYFQAYTNTYAPVDVLRKLFWEAVSDPDVVILSIATRPDCLSEEVLSLLDELNQYSGI